VSKKAIALSVCFTLSACASYPSSVQPAYVSPASYSGARCEQLSQERRRLDSELPRVTDQQRTAANVDTATMTVGMLVFWPALFGLAFDTDHSAELSQLKGQARAIDEALATGTCSRSTPPTQLVGTQSAAVMPAHPVKKTAAGQCFSYSPTTGRVTAVIEC
jgi:hypothetical protein